MTLPVVWLPEADADAHEAVAWYRNIRSALGDQFALGVEARSAPHPLRFPIVYRNRRRAGIHRFPYGIFFEVQVDRIVVIACLHNRRDPRRWQLR